MKIEKALKNKKGTVICLEAMKHLANRHHTRSYPELSQKDWGDYTAVRILDALYHLNSILEPIAKVPVTYGFEKGN